MTAINPSQSIRLILARSNDPDSASEEELSFPLPRGGTLTFHQTMKAAKAMNGS
jgi:hypothetical protein